MRRLLKIFRRKPRRKTKGRYPSYKSKSRKNVPVLESKRGGASRPSSSKRTLKAGFLRRLWHTLLALLRRMGFALAVLFVLSAGYLWLSLPDIAHLDTLTKARSILVKSESGATLGSYGDIYGDFIRYKALPEPLNKAVLATEDRNFFHHFGVDPERGQHRRSGDTAILVSRRENAVLDSRCRKAKHAGLHFVERVDEILLGVASFLAGFRSLDLLGEHFQFGLLGPSVDDQGRRTDDPELERLKDRLLGQQAGETHRLFADLGNFRGLSFCLLSHFVTCRAMRAQAVPAARQRD